MPDSATLTKAALGLGVCYAIAKFAPHQAVKAGAYGVMAFIVAKQLPIVKDAL